MKQVLGRTVILSLLSISLAFASANEKAENFSTLSTMELQKKVETLSATHNLPFGMGVELMKRWSNS